MRADLVIRNAAQLLTCASPNGPKRGGAMTDVGLIEDGAIAIVDGIIEATGSTKEILSSYTAENEIDVSGKVICPGFVDAHTHAVYSGDRAAEFESRIQGKTYMQIMQEGGGIASTTRATRSVRLDQLVAESRPRLDSMLKLGTTTAEIKTGYGLNPDAELKILKAIQVLDQYHPIQLVPTFLGAHAIPDEYKGNSDAYVDLVIDEMIPLVVDWVHSNQIPVLFCDVFCEDGVFDIRQTRKILETARASGLGIKLHADEFSNLGGVSLAVEMGAASVDHLDVTPVDEIETLAASETIGVILPAVNFNLGYHTFADARALLDAGAAIALATDINPGSAPCPSLPLVMAISCRYQHLMPSEALNACTINAAHALRLGDQIGSLEPGKQADVLILDTNDYRHIPFWFGVNFVQHVIKKGKLVL